MVINEREQDIERFTPLLFDHIPDPVYIFDKSGSLTRMNAAGVTAGFFVAKSVVNKATWDRHFERALTGEIMRVRVSFGEMVSDRYQTEATLLPSIVQGRMGVICILSFEVTVRDEIIRRSFVELEKYRWIDRYLTDFVVVLGLDGTIQHASASHETLFGISSDKIIGRNAFDLVHPDDVEHLQARFADVLNFQPYDPPIEFRYSHADGHWIIMEVRGNSVIVDGKVKAVVCVARDISQRKSTEEMVRHIAFHDALTGLPNRRYFSQELENLIVQIEEGKGLAAVMFIDLDRFKMVNDTMGHAVGDLLLQQIAQRLADCLPETCTVYRMGGDEFTVLHRDVANEAEAISVAKQILEMFSAPLCLNDREFYLTASVGVSFCPLHGRDVDTIMRSADAAMYSVKDAGKNCFQVYEPKMNLVTTKRLAFEESLHRALQRDELFLHYQPRINLRTGRIVSVEAFVRWNEPNEGLMFPADFLPIAESTGLILPLGKRILSSACRQNKSWQEAGFTPIRISVNISFQQFIHPDFIAVVRQTLQETRLDPVWLELEITEGTIAQDADLALATLQRLKDIGISICIDDFGTGHFSLSSLKRFPIDCLKIDPIFVREAVRNGQSAEVLQAIIFLAHGLRVTAVGEEVETEAERQLLMMQGCDELQGNLYKEPVCAHGLEQVFSEYGFFDS